MRRTLPLIAFTLLAGSALAQAPAGSASPPAPAASTAPAPAPAHPHMTLQQRFDQANTTHDGHLTLDQAKAGMPRVAKHFEAIDKDKKGYVTADEVRAYLSEHRAAHRAAHHPASPT